MSIIQPTGIFNTSLILVLVHSSCLAKGKYIYLYVIPSSRADLMLQVGWIYTKKCSIFVHSIWVLIMCLCEDAIIGYRYSKRLVQKQTIKQTRPVIGIIMKEQQRNKGLVCPKDWCFYIDWSTCNQVLVSMVQRYRPKGLCRSLTIRSFTH